MTTEYFHKDKDKKDGFHTICKDCRRGKPKEVDNTPEGFIKCTKCENILPATSEYFHRDKYNKKYGLRRRCKDCSTKNGRNYVPGKDITGQRFGKLVAVRPTDRKVGTNIVWEMKCDCGNTTYVHTGNLGESQRKTKSCGCLHKEVVSISLVGNKYGRLSVVEQGKHIGDKIAWVCKCECGNITEVSGDHLKSGATQSCGCMHRGKLHHNYNPNKTDEERLKKRYILGKHTIDEFRNKVYQRDEYTCRVCGQVGGTLNAHHLDGWNWAKDNRFKTSNGVTLCEDCHSKFHNVYGKGNNTKEQFEEFKSKITQQTKPYST